MRNTCPLWLPVTTAHSCTLQGFPTTPSAPRLFPAGWRNATPPTSPARSWPSTMTMTLSLLTNARISSGRAGKLTHTGIPPPNAYTTLLSPNILKPFTCQLGRFTKGLTHYYRQVHGCLEGGPSFSWGTLAVYMVLGVACIDGGVPSLYSIIIFHEKWKYNHTHTNVPIIYTYTGQGPDLNSLSLNV